MKSKDSVLLIDPTSINHLPPKILNKSESDRSKKYSDALNLAVSKKLNNNEEIINAFSGKFAVNYGLLMLGHLLSNENINVELISGDYFSTEKEFFEYLKILANKYKVAALTSTTPQFEQVKNINKILKENNKYIKTILGGPHTLYYKTAPADDNIDIIHIGHGIDKSAKIIMDILKGNDIKEKILKTDYYYNI